MSVTRTVVLGTALILISCESATDKAARLREDMTTKCSRIMPGMAEAEDVSLPQKQADCDVATRDFNAFMAGK